MSLFKGTSQRNIDPKGRLMLPPEFRDGILSASGAGELVLTKSLDKCVVGYAMDEWAQVEASLANIRNPTRTLRAMQRLIIGSAHTAALDKQGRVLVPPLLRDYGSLSKDVVLYGAGHRIEIWDKVLYDAENAIDPDVAMEELQQRGLEVRF